MKIDYKQIFKKNITNILIEVLKNIEKNGLSEGNHLYITFQTDHKKVIMPMWLKEKYPKEMTIVIQHEYYNLKIKKDRFFVGLSFNDINADLEIDYGSVISFADPFANFGLKLIEKEKDKSEKSNIKNKKTNNIIDFKSYKKN